MFASRLPAHIESSALATLIAKARASGAALLDLTESNPTRAGFHYPQAEILAGFQDPRILHYDPESLGLADARAQVARLHNASPDRIVLTTSTSEAYSWLFKLLCDPGDEVLVPSPSYPLFEFLAALESVEVRHYPLRYSDGWFTDLHSLEARITPRTRAVILVNPNNPTGSYLKPSEQERIIAVCEAHSLALISDEVFADYSIRESCERAPSLTSSPVSCLAVSLNGLSKMAGMPQMKLGWMVLSGPPPLQEEARARLEVIADTYLSVGTPVQHAIGSLLHAGSFVKAQILQRVRENLSWLREQVPGTAATLLDVEGGWSVILRVPQTRSEEDWVTMLLQDYAVLVQPGYFYDFACEAYLVLSLLTPPTVFRDGVGRLLTALASDG